MPKHFSFRKYDKDILFAIVEQAGNQLINAGGSGRNEHSFKGRGHRELKRMTEQATGQTFSTGTFDKYLDLLVASKVLSKAGRHRRGGKAEYRVTQKAMQEYRAGVLRVEAVEPDAFADEEERYRLYRLLFAIETIESAVLEFYDTEEGILGQLKRLFAADIMPEDLKVHKVEREEVDCKVTHYKPVKCLSITKREYRIPLPETTGAGACPKQSRLSITSEPRAFQLQIF